MLLFTGKNHWSTIVIEQKLVRTYSVSNASENSFWKYSDEICLQIPADVWIFDFSEQKLIIFRSKKWILFVFKAFEGLK